MILNELYSGGPSVSTGTEIGYDARQGTALQGVAEGCMLTMVSPLCGPVAVEERGVTPVPGRDVIRTIRVVKVDRCG